jgi:topoisomerase-4 subunit A
MPLTTRWCAHGAGLSQRHPLIDGTHRVTLQRRRWRRGDALLSTEARLARITSPLMSIDSKVMVDFIPNHDGSIAGVAAGSRPPACRSILLNLCQRIAAGLATVIPSHNLREIADACVAPIKTPKLTDDELFATVPGSDYPVRRPDISSAIDIAEVSTGRARIVSAVRARWITERIVARGQWAGVLTELPPGVSLAAALEEIEELTNAKVRAGKKALSSEQAGAWADQPSKLIGARRTSKDAAVRLVFEPKTSRIEQQDSITTLLASPARKFFRRAT